MLGEAAERITFAFLAAGAIASDAIRLEDWRVEAVYTKTRHSRLEHIKIQIQETYRLSRS